MDAVRVSTWIPCPVVLSFTYRPTQCNSPWSACCSGGVRFCPHFPYRQDSAASCEQQRRRTNVILIGRIDHPLGWLNTHTLWIFYCETLSAGQSPNNCNYERVPQTISSFTRRQRRCVWRYLWSKWISRFSYWNQTVPMIGFAQISSSTISPAWIRIGQKVIDKKNNCRHYYLCADKLWSYKSILSIIFLSNKQ